MRFGRPASGSAPDRSAILDAAGMALLWFAGVMLVRPGGNFPLNDDWSYGLTVRHLLATGQFHPLGWTAMPVLTHTLWGALFCLPFGFSFTALRASTLALSLVGILGVYVLARDERLPRWLAVLLALTLGFNPVYFALSNTFMADVPFTTLVVLAVLFFAR